MDTEAAAFCDAVMILHCSISAHSHLFRLMLRISCHVSSTGSKKEREVYEKAGRRVTDPTNESAEPGQLQLSIKHAKPVFGTDFDVIVEVGELRLWLNE